MRKLVVGAFVTLDGVMQAPGGPDEDRDGGFEHGGWSVPYFDDQIFDNVYQSLTKAGALLIGRKTYDIFAPTWPLAGDDDQFGVIMNSIPKYVVSRTLKAVDWNNSRLLSGDIAAEVTRLKNQEGGEIQVHGSSALIQTLLQHDLVDEFHLRTFPVLVGGGKRLFADGTLPRGLTLVESITAATGVTMNTYRREGGLTYGAIGPEEENTPWRD